MSYLFTCGGKVAVNFVCVSVISVAFRWIFTDVAPLVAALHHCTDCTIATPVA